MIGLQGNRLYDGQKLLKELYCPDDYAKSAIQRSSESIIDCKTCGKTVHDTDYLSEDQIRQLIADNPDVCLRINPYNPIFKILEE